MGKYGQFIKAMQEKYMGLMSNDGLDGVPLTAVAPSRLAGKEGGNGEQPILVPSGEGAGTGARYMGRSDAMVRQADKPAGIVEEDEMVVEADMVDKAGGPGRVREGLEVLADMKEKGIGRSFQTGTGAATAGGKKMRDPETGQMVPAAEYNLKRAKERGDTDAIERLTPQQTNTTTPGLDTGDITDTADDLTKDLLDRPDSRFAKTTDKAIGHCQLSPAAAAIKSDRVEIKSSGL